MVLVEINDRKYGIQRKKHPTFRPDIRNDTFLTGLEDDRADDNHTGNPEHADLRTIAVCRQQPPDKQKRFPEHRLRMVIFGVLLGYEYGACKVPLPDIGVRFREAI